MSTLTAALTWPGGDAHRDVTDMATAMSDRAPAWVSADSAAPAEAALAVGAATAHVAKSSIRHLENGVRLAIAGPVWVCRQLDAIGPFLETGAVDADAVAEVLAGVHGDAHVAALIGTRCAVIYRSPVTARPLFYTVKGDGTVLVASQVRGVTAAMVDAGVDLGGLAPFLVPAMCDPAGSAWQGVRRLPPGHALIIEFGRTRVRKMQDLAPVELSGGTRQDYAAEFRRRLLVAIERCSGPPDAVLLSGGIDSAALTCAATVAALTPEAFSLTYSTVELAACDERSFVDDIEYATKVPVARMPADHLLPLLVEYPLSDEPEAWTYSARNAAMLRHIAGTSRASTVIAGEGGDELLLGQVFTVADRRVQGDTDGAARELQTFPDPVAAQRVVDALINGGYNHRGAKIMRALDDIPTWLSDRYLADTGLADRLADSYPQLDAPGRLAVDYSRSLIAEAGAAGRVHCGGWWEDAGRKNGLAITYPFLDPDLAAFTWGLPPHLLRNNGIEKVILRESLAPELPASIMQRLDKADARAMMHTGLRRSADQLRAVATSGPLVDHDVIEPDRLLTAIDEYLAGHDRHGPALWATTAVNTWMLHQQGGIHP
ncbi:asparagine synthase-related protein [Nocardia sp. NBC_00416]|uniref:asparagine synthase-related protein n=1 Tax=Nocardia sp. NBC_00416 TaxID=2975991 RepID=UPI002E250A8D